MINTIKIIILGNGKLPQWLRELLALAEDPNLVPKTYMVAFNHLYLQFQVI